MKRIITIFLCTFVLTACQTVQTSVESYSQITEEPTDKTIYITSRKQKGSLRWKANRDILAQKLSDKGYVVTESRSKAQHVAYFDFFVDKGRVVNYTSSNPQWGVTGYSGGTTTGTVTGNTFTGTTTLYPTYGITGYTETQHSYVSYGRDVVLTIFDKRSGKKLYQGVASSSGSCSTFTAVAPYVLEALLKEFPKGKIGKVELPSKVKC